MDKLFTHNPVDWALPSTDKMWLKSIGIVCYCWWLFGHGKIDATHWKHIGAHSFTQTHWNIIHMQSLETTRLYNESHSLIFILVPIKRGKTRAGAVVQQVRPPPAMPASQYEHSFMFQLFHFQPISLLMRLENQWEMAQVPRFLHWCGRPGWSACFLALVWPWPGYCNHLGSEVVDRGSLSVSLSPLFVTLPFK